MNQIVSAQKVNMKITLIRTAKLAMKDALPATQLICALDVKRIEY